jgi:protein phosphatase methylesterase 1
LFLHRARTSSRGTKGEFYHFEAEPNSFSILFTVTLRLPCSLIRLAHINITRSITSKNKFTPLPWTDFFSQELYFDRKENDLQIKHHAYFTPPMPEGPLFVTHHGAGSSGLSFAAFTSEIHKLLPKSGVLSLDARGHGSTTITSPTSQASPIDLSLDTLSADLVYILTQTLAKLSQKTPSPIILVGHSLGGAVITHTAHKHLLTLSPLGYAVLDVVEGSAIEALQSMSTYLSTRPSSFPSLPSAIEWHLKSRTIRNLTCARVSVPPLLLPSSSSESSSYTWRTDLSATQPYWSSWFTGLSSKFLQTPGPAKLLLLAGTDRLDKDLTIGQMQGKFQMQIFPETGHFIHEDQPAKTAAVLADFYRRNDRRSLVLPPKVGELIAQGKLSGKGSG